VVGAQPTQLPLARGDLGVQVVDQAHRRGGGARPRLGQPQAGQQRPAAGAEQVAGQARPPERQQRGVHPVLQRDPVADQVQPEPGPLAFGTHLGLREPDRGHQLAAAQLGQDPGVDPVGLARQRRQPLTFCASAIWTSHPASSSWSCTNRAPFIDSIAATTGSPNPASCRASPRSPSASGATAVTWTASPASFMTCASNRCRDRSNPACNMVGASSWSLPW
jgi:hypothetical protein